MKLWQALIEERSMGNTGSGKRERHDTNGAPASPSKEDRAFEFGGKKNRFLYQTSLDDSEDCNYKDKSEPMAAEMRPRASTVTPGTTLDETALPTVFKWDGGGKEVHISGTFTGWKPIPMVRSSGDFTLILEIPEGEHQYKFLVDGQWRHDSKESVVDNELGTKNNLIRVRKSDFEVFEALAMDSVNSGSQKVPLTLAEGPYEGNKKDADLKCSPSLQWVHRGIAGSPPGEYSQEIPAPKPYSKCLGPPILPPHLLQVILNKDVPISCEPTLLPEPNHVMLNHLYALSIKDGVMVLSATHRYRKKYVTTLLYKPI
ncbi:PRKAB2 [Cordylochernes scorpioides]|uniref:5'-AMP-activated protein kinase subunit beta-1 n=1 Tax=Cordylochernes scorpioides TaxID=51811 RepID=A0ABY6KIB3_9ARAC|nr:PRKAB2 [Cordylochernes scorpioides]